MSEKKSSRDNWEENDQERRRKSLEKKIHPSPVRIAHYQPSVMPSQLSRKWKMKLILNPKFLSPVFPPIFDKICCWSWF